MASWLCGCRGRVHQTFAFILCWQRNISLPDGFHLPGGPRVAESEVEADFLAQNQLSSWQTVPTSRRSRHHGNRDDVLVVVQHNELVQRRGQRNVSERFGVKRSCLRTTMVSSLVVKTDTETEKWNLGGHDLINETRTQAVRTLGLGNCKLDELADLFGAGKV